MAEADGRVLKPGEAYRLTWLVSVQFACPIVVRVVRVLWEWTASTTPGWAWIDCYQLNAGGVAVDRRTLYVQPAAAELLVVARPAPARVHLPRQRDRRAG